MLSQPMFINDAPTIGREMSSVESMSTYLLTLYPWRKYMRPTAQAGCLHRRGDKYDTVSPPVGVG